MKQLKEYMAKNNISCKDLASSANIHKSDLSMVLNGKKPFYPAWRKRIAEYLNIPEDVLFPEYTKK